MKYTIAPKKSVVSAVSLKVGSVFISDAGAKMLKLEPCYNVESKFPDYIFCLNLSVTSGVLAMIPKFEQVTFEGMAETVTF